MPLSAAEKEEAANDRHLTLKQKTLRNAAVTVGIFVILAAVLKCDAFSWDWLAIGSLIVAVFGVILQYGARFGEKLDHINASQVSVEQRLNNVESYLKYGKKGRFDPN